MFGYVRPLRCELKLREFEVYKASYCGLCRTLSQRYGLRARMLVRYDIVFFVLTGALYAPPAQFKDCRCPFSPWARRPHRMSDGVSELAADLLVLLFDLKLQDTRRDEKGFRRLGAGFLSLLNRGPHKKARARRPREALVMQNAWERFCREEDSGGDLAQMADAFGEMLTVFAEADMGVDTLADAERRILRHLFFHLGRWIYLIDAADDAPKDIRRNRFTPLRALLPRDIEPGTALRAAVADILTPHLWAARAELDAAVALLPRHPMIPLVENVTALGLPTVERLVLSGQFLKRNGKGDTAAALSVDTPPQMNH